MNGVPMRVSQPLSFSRSEIRPSARSFVAGRQNRSVRSVRLLAIALVIAALGPYLAGGFRVEQVFIYCMALIGLPRVLLDARLRPQVFTLLLTWTILFVSVAASSWGAPEVASTHSLISGIDNLLLPFAALIVGVVWGSLHVEFARAELLTAVSRWLIGLLCVNTAVAVLSLFRDISWIGRFFWGTGESESVAVRALEAGRATGLFNQPHESGIAYSMGLILLVYLYRKGRAPKLGLTIPIAGLLVLGGVLSVSKGLLLLGIPIATILLMLSATGRRRFILGAPVIVTCLILVFTGLPWEGRERLEGLTASPGDRGALDFYTAGRLGTEGTVTLSIDKVLRTSPAMGFGFRGIAVAYDNAWLEMLMVGGLWGATLYTLALLLLANLALKIKRKAERHTGLALVALCVLGGLGGPTLSLNRVGSILCLLLGVLISTPWRDSSVVQ